MAEDAIASVANTLASPRSRKPSAPRSIDDLAEKARQAVKKLAVEEFLRDNVHRILDKLVAYDELTSTRGRGDVTFATLSLPVASGVIHVASDPEKLDDTSDWLRREDLVVPQDDALSVLAVLVLLYTIDEGRKGTWARLSHDDKKKTAEDVRAEKKIWQGFWKRLGKAMKDI